MTNVSALFAMTDLFWYFLAAEIHVDITKYVCPDSFVMLGLQKNEELLMMRCQHLSVFQQNCTFRVVCLFVL